MSEERHNVTLEYDLQDANEIISFVAVRSYEWSEQVKEWRHSLTSELHEKLLTATNEIILLASSKKML